MREVRKGESPLPSSLALLGLWPGRTRAALVEDLHRLEQINRPLELDVLLEELLRRRLAIGLWLRRRLRRSRRRRWRLRLLHDDVRRQPLAVDAAALRGEVLGRREPQPRPVG